MAMIGKWVKFPSRPMAVGIIVLAVLGVALVSGLGLMAPITQLLGRTVGAAKAGVMKLFGQDRRKAA